MAAADQGADAGAEQSADHRAANRVAGRLAVGVFARDAVAIGPTRLRVGAGRKRSDDARAGEKRGGAEALLPFTPLNRLVTPVEVADAIGFLCSEQASGIAGVVLPVDAGQRAF